MTTIADTVHYFAGYAQNKAQFLKSNPVGFAVSALMAGAYVGVGIILILSVGQTADASIRNLVMGASFGIALILVVFAGSDLFTGHAMYATHGRLLGTIGNGDALRSWAATWSGNLVGSICVATLFIVGGGGVVLHSGGETLLYAVASKKMSGSAIELIARGMLCNWLVCLSLWSGARTKNDAAKCIIIFWCLYAFIASGFEHSVANMTVFSLALLSDPPASVTVSGAAHNLLWVTVGNLLSGVIVMGFGYWLVAGRPGGAKISIRTEGYEKNLPGNVEDG
ncbi:MAG: nitrite transporter NirC [Hyphomicrobium sp.]|nr:nitrite transporter NirC [Hyphomicrobium sp.]